MTSIIQEILIDYHNILYLTYDLYLHIMYIKGPCHGREQSFNCDKYDIKSLKLYKLIVAVKMYFHLLKRIIWTEGVGI